MMTMQESRRRRFLRFAVVGAAAWCACAQAAELPAPPKGLSAPAKPLAMPEFDLPTIDGGTLRSESLRGQVLLVRYWASW
jgi:hypothetical protein